MTKNWCSNEAQPCRKRIEGENCWSEILIWNEDQWTVAEATTDHVTWSAGADQGQPKDCSGRNLCNNGKLWEPLGRDFKDLDFATGRSKYT